MIFPLFLAAWSAMTVDPSCREQPVGQAAEAPGPPLKPSTLACAYTSPQDPPMDSRLTRLEVTIDHIQGDLRDLRSGVRHFQTEVRSEFRIMRDQARVDFRLLFGALISLAIGMSAMMAKGFHWF